LMIEAPKAPRTQVLDLKAQTMLQRKKRTNLQVVDNQSMCWQVRPTKF
jgi:hypothetical protein